MVLATLLYKSMNFNSLKGVFESLFTDYSDNILNTFIDKLFAYIIIYIISILVGLCIIGFPIINIEPFVIGFIIALKLCYYYNLYKFKGVGYSLLMIVPETAFVMTVVTYTIKKSRGLSKEIFDKAMNKNNNELNTLDYFKSYSLYLLLIIIVSAVNSLMIYLFSFIIKI